MRKHLKYSITQVLLFATFVVTAQNKPNGSSIPSATAVTLPASYASGVKVNYVRTKEAVAPITDASTFNAAGYTQVKEATSYMDGLGRPLQTVVKQASPLLKDMVSPVLYDAYGREQYKYLPFISMDNSGNFKLNPFAQQQGFMQAQYSGESVYYNETVFEASPLNRVTKTMAAGNSWAGSSKGVSMEYRINDANDQVRIWNITNGETDVPTTSTTYGAGELYEQHTIDEHNKRVVEYKDKEGRVVLKKVQIDDSPSEHYTGWLCTFYVYDDFGLLRFVIPPKATQEMAASSWSLSTDQINELSFRYHYDGKNRMIAKKVPGAGWVYMVYDKRDRLTFTQDANMRSSNKWMISLYDELNRPTTTGMITYSGTRDQLQALLDQRYDAAQATSTAVNFMAPDILYVSERQAGKPTYRAVTEIQFNGDFTVEEGGSFETFLEPAILSTQTILLNYDPFPSGANFIALTLNFYDDYAATGKTYNTANNYKLDAGSNAYPETLPSTATTLTRGMPTVTRTRVLENINDLSAGAWLETAIYYDEEGKAIQTQSDNYKNGTDITTTRYDFTGKPITVYQVHNNAAAGQTVSTKTNMNYDHAGRLQNVQKTLNDNTATTRYLTRNEYDELGQLKNKKLGQYAISSTELENQVYDYNIRGWLKGINKEYANNVTGGVYFGMELSYDWGFDNNQFNGNIAGAKWRSKGDGEQRAYGYGYDAANRLLKADFTQNNGSWNQSAGMNFNVLMGDGATHTTAYDANGNIKGMQQWGFKLNTSNQIDNLSYAYSTSSNKLNTVTDAITADQKLADFTDKNTSGADYAYDNNGNLTQDKNKDITSISYNHLNLPYLITVNGKGTIKYIYDAAGNKLEKRTVETSPQSKTTNTAYLNGYVYENNVLQYFGHEEGRVRFENSVFLYDYFVKDHLGNTRVVLTDEQKTDAYPVASLEAATLANEKLFYSIPEDGATRVNKNTVAGYPNDSYTNPNDYIHKLNGNGTKVGTSITLKVMAGDSYNLRANSWYRLNGASPASPINPLTSIVTNLISGVAAASAGKATVTALQNGSVLDPAVTNFLNTQTVTSGKPKAYLNWVLLDEQFKYAGGGFEQVGDNEVFTTHTRTNLPVTKNGYLYVYVSNETPNVDVFFDNVQVSHVRGPLLSESHYYPFGLEIAALSSKAAGKLENKIKFTRQELDADLGWNNYQMKFRTHDPQIGRFLQIDPLASQYVHNSTFAYAENDVIRAIDVEGLEKLIVTYNFQQDNISNKKISLEKAGPLGDGVLVISNHAGSNSYYYGKPLKQSNLPAFKFSYEGVKKDKEGNHIYYQDINGYPTIGYGHLIKKGDPYNVNSKLSEQQALDLFNSDSKSIFEQASKHLKEFDLSVNENDALYDAAFNLGPNRLSTFSSEGGKYSGSNFFFKFMSSKDGEGNIKRRFGENVLYEQGIYIHFDKASLNSGLVKQVLDLLNPKKDEKKINSIFYTFSIIFITCAACSQNSKESLDGQWYLDNIKNLIIGIGAMNKEGVDDSLMSSKYAKTKCIIKNNVLYIQTSNFTDFFIDSSISISPLIIKYLKIQDTDITFRYPGDELVDTLAEKKVGESFIKLLSYSGDSINVSTAKGQKNNYRLCFIDATHFGLFSIEESILLIFKK